MPIHLPPISRRQFLRRALTAGAGLATAPELLAASKRADADSWALLSDTHIAADAKQVARNTNMFDNLTKAGNEVVALSKRPAAVLVCGDCAYNSGESGDYATFTKLLQPMREAEMPIHLALGNHDHRARFWEALQSGGAAKRPVVDRHVAIIRAQKANWFILDSLDKTLVTPGVLGEEQLAWLAQALDENQSKPAIVMVHHNPDKTLGVTNNGALRDTAKFFEIIRPRKHVKAYIFGHTHFWTVEQDPSGIHLINLPPVAYVFREGEPNGWVHATLQGDGMKLELRCLDTKHKLHGQIVQLDWRKA